MTSIQAAVVRWEAVARKRMRTWPRPTLTHRQTMRALLRQHARGSAQSCITANTPRTTQPAFSNATSNCLAAQNSKPKKLLGVPQTTSSAWRWRAASTTSSASMGGKRTGSCRQHPTSWVSPRSRFKGALLRARLGPRGRALLCVAALAARLAGTFAASGAAFATRRGF